MALFVTVSSGERAGLSRPICAISDQELVAEMLRPLGRLFGACAPFVTTDDEEAPVPLHPHQTRETGKRMPSTVGGR